MSLQKNNKKKLKHSKYEINNFSKVSSKIVVKFQKVE